MAGYNGHGGPSGYNGYPQIHRGAPGIISSQYQIYYSASDLEQIDSDDEEYQTYYYKKAHIYGNALADERYDAYTNGEEEYKDNTMEPIYERIRQNASVHDVKRHPLFNRQNGFVVPDSPAKTSTQPKRSLPEVGQKISARSRQSSPTPTRTLPCPPHNKNSYCAPMQCQPTRMNHTCTECQTYFYKKAHIYGNALADERYDAYTNGEEEYKDNTTEPIYERIRQYASVHDVKSHPLFKRQNGFVVPDSPAKTSTQPKRSLPEVGQKISARSRQSSPTPTRTLPCPPHNKNSYCAPMQCQPTRMNHTCTECQTYFYKKAHIYGNALADERYDAYTNGEEEYKDNTTEPIYERIQQNASVHDVKSHPLFKRQNGFVVPDSPAKTSTQPKRSLPEVGQKISARSRQSSPTPTRTLPCPPHNKNSYCAPMQCQPTRMNHTCTECQTYFYKKAHIYGNALADERYDAYTNGEEEYKDNTTEPIYERIQQNASVHDVKSHPLLKRQNGFDVPDSPAKTSIQPKRSLPEVGQKISARSRQSSPTPTRTLPCPPHNKNLDYPPVQCQPTRMNHTCTGNNISPDVQSEATGEQAKLYILHPLVIAPQQGCVQSFLNSVLYLCPVAGCNGPPNHKCC